MTALLLEAIRRTESREGGFRLVGLEHLLTNRNHHRRLRSAAGPGGGLLRQDGRHPARVPGLSRYTSGHVPARR